MPSFGDVADEVIASLSTGFRNPKHRAQWAMTINVYAAALRPKPVDSITTEDVLAVLKPIWAEKGETASRLRGRIEKVLDAAKARGHRSGENPTRWRGHLDHLLARPQKLARGHHAAMPYPELPGFIGRLRERSGGAAAALEFLILCAARSGEVTGAKPWEIDVAAAVWTIPPERMKAGREHRVPLSDRACEIVRAMLELNGPGEFLFSGQRQGRPLSDAALSAVLDRMGVANATVHGFRSSFRDWAGNETNFPREIAEHALAHVIGDKAEQAYRRSDALKRRRQLMQAWADYVDSGEPGGVVVPLQNSAAAE